MRALALATLLLASGTEIGHVETWLEQAFYPALLLILVTASLGIPIPEDIPLIAAGVILKTHPTIASWHGTIIVALVGIMTGDLVLYTLGKRWGPGIVNHRIVRWMITPTRFARLSQKFHRYGAWLCFFGRFFVGIRGAMCMTAGATGFPYWRFFIADCAGALLSIPFFVFLGFWFAGMIPTLLGYVTDAQTSALVLVVVVAVVGIVIYKTRKQRRARRIAALRTGSSGSAGEPAATASSGDRDARAARDRIGQAGTGQRSLTARTEPQLPGGG